MTAIAEDGFLRHSGFGDAIPSEIKWAGYDLIVIEGISDRPVYLNISVYTRHINVSSVSYIFP